MSKRQKSLGMIGESSSVTKCTAEAGPHNEEQQMAADCPVHPRILALPVSQAISTFLGAALQQLFQQF